ncbi:ferrichrome ABC transporter substrate-binding protein [Lysinibacillus sp. 2017]|uniref:siderophore ABC transporter substrate-binding protein n=1 Tax=unclassified Lysinibacillus TaxID=2636778 RepID=UPI000D526B90|nr:MULTISPECIES: siderophore ABC transporter substrate-binding protein [unclassified Lysinibacillus]AWE08959.1 ferrichrome ABC transporter substrate-binding protein [Lysinibacillus sp. 2017]TGN35531.1 siderophore ABC transporter substrate-binding protein [Lysinibacillus sp. S2017]
MKKWKFLTAAALTLMLAACGSDEESSTEGTNDQAATEQATENKEAAAVETPAFPMTVSSLSPGSETEDGKSLTFGDVTFEEMPKNIVVFDYGFLDTLDALGVEGVVGIAANGGKGNFPEHLKEKYLTDAVADVGTLKSIDFEKVAATQPDAIFISGRQASYYEELKEITPNVVFIGSDNENYIDGVFETVDLAAQIFGKEEKAEELKANLQTKVDAVSEKAKGYENALVAMYNDKKISGFDNGPESRFAYVYNDFGFVPATTDIKSSSHGSDFSYESILSVNPEVLLIIDRTASDVETIKADIENDIIKQTRAYKEGKIVYLDGTTWYFSSNGITTEADKLDEILNELK